MITLNLPYIFPTTPDQQAANNISAMMQLQHMNLAPSIALQIKRHINLVHIVQDHTMYKDTVY